VQQLLELLATELERPRAVSAQVTKHLTGTYDVGREALGAFLVNALPKLEDYEIDLALAPLFTPTLPDQAVFADFLGRESIPPTHWPELIRQLAARPATAQLVTDDEVTHRVALRDVTLERFVHRLRLEGNIPETLFRLLAEFPAAPERPLLKALARRAVWESEPRRRILVRYLTAAAAGGTYRRADATGLLQLAETYQPANLAELLAQLPHWQQVLVQEINTGAGSKPFFNERVEELHGGGRDQRRSDHTRLTAKEHELEFLQRLQAILCANPPK